MEDKKLPIHLPWTARLFFTLASLCIIFYILIIGKPIIMPLTYAMIFSLILYPLCKRFEALGISRILAISITMLVALSVVVMVVWLLYDNIVSLASDYPKMQERAKELISLAQSFLEQKFHLSSEKQITWLRQNIEDIMAAGMEILNGFLHATTTFLTDLVLIPIYVFLMLLYRDIYKGFMQRIIQKEHHLERALMIEKKVQNVLQKYILGMFLVVIIIAVINIVGLTLIGIKNALFFGFLAALLTIIPYVGIFIGASLPILYALMMTDSLFYPIALLVWFPIVQFLEGNFITPNIIGSSVSMNPIIAMLVLIIGGHIWGISGMILFVPLTAMIKVILDNIPSLSPYGFLLGEGEPQEETKPSMLKKIVFWKKS